MKQIIVFILCLSALVGCNQRDNLMPQLIHIDSVAIQKGNTAAKEMLDSFIPELIDDNESRAYYWLLKTYIGIKCQIEIKSTVGIDNSISYYKMTNNKEKLAKCYICKAYILEHTKKRAEALAYLKGAEILISDYDNSGVLLYEIYVQIAMINNQAQEHTVALNYGKKALKMAYQLHEDGKIAKALLNLHRYYEDVGLKDSAQYTLARLNPLANALKPEDKALLYDNIALSLLSNSPDEAEKYLKMSLALHPSTYTYEVWANLYHARGEFEKACVMWRRALQTDDCNFKVEVLKEIYECQKETGNYKSASETAIWIAALKDSISQMEKDQDLRGVQEQFENELQASYEQAKLLSMLSMVLPLLLFVTAIAAYFYTKNKKGRQKLDETRQEIDRYRERLSILEKEGKTDTKEVERLTKKISELQARQNAQLQNGRERFEEIAAGGTTLRWSRSDFEDCIEYYRTIDAAFVVHMEQDYRHLSFKYIFFALMEHLGRTDEELQHIMAISQSTVRSNRSRINNSAL